MDKNGNANYLSQDIVNSVKVSVNTVLVDAFLPINLVAASFDLYFLTIFLIMISSGYTAKLHGYRLLGCLGNK